MGSDKHRRMASNYQVAVGRIRRLAEWALAMELPGVPLAHQEDHDAFCAAIISLCKEAERENEV